jgi:hypothetical protein
MFSVYIEGSTFSFLKSTDKNFQVYLEAGGYVKGQNLSAIRRAFQKNEKSSLQWAFSTCDTRWVYISYWGDILKFKISLVF